MTSTTWKRLVTLAPALGTAYLHVLPEFESAFPASRLAISQGYRTPEMQRAAHDSGASPFDGLTRTSKHQCFPSQAVDLAVFDPDGTYATDGEDKRYRWLGHAFERLGFEWGGEWAKPDWDHMEIQGPGISPQIATSEAHLWETVLQTFPHFRV